MNFATFGMMYHETSGVAFDIVVKDSTPMKTRGECHEISRFISSHRIECVGRL